LVALLHLPKANSWSSVHSSWYCAFVCSCLCIISKEKFLAATKCTRCSAAGRAFQRERSACAREEPEQMLLIRFVSEAYVLTGSEHLWPYQNLAPIPLLGTCIFKSSMVRDAKREKELRSLRYTQHSRRKDQSSKNHFLARERKTETWIARTRTPRSLKALETDERGDGVEHEG